MSAPTAPDFLLHEIPPIIDRLAGDYENFELPVQSLPGIRVLITGGALVSIIAVYAVLATDGSVTDLVLEVGGRSTPVLT